MKMSQNSKHEYILLFVTLLAALILTLTYFSINSTGEKSETEAKWTVLVYMAGDNNLEDAAVDDINEMEYVGSDERINIIVQVDRAEGYDRTNGDWEDTRRYRVEKDLDYDNLNSTRLDTGLGELDMADGNNLRDFLVWGVENYPAERFLVVLWDHGLGWNGGVLRDNSRYMPISELRTALSQAKEQWGGKYNILGFDACLMGGAEVFYQLDDYANYSFGSEKNVPTDGLPYNDFLRALKFDPNMSEERLVREISDNYVSSYAGISSISVQYSGINVTALPKVTKSMNSLTEELIRQMPYYYDQVLEARLATEEYEKSHHYDYFDLLDFFRQAGVFLDNPRYLSKLEKLEDAVEKAVVKNEIWSLPNETVDTVMDSTGMSVYFPDPGGGGVIFPDYNKYIKTTFSKNTLWDEFLTEMFNYNDEDFMENRSIHCSLTKEISYADSDFDGDIDSFNFGYRFNSTKGDDPGNFTIETIVLDSNGKEAARWNSTSGNEGNITFNVVDYSFDLYEFNIYLWNGDNILQQYHNHTHDFRRYGVEIDVFSKDSDGKEIPLDLTASPGQNKTFFIRINNTGNSEESFIVSLSGMPMKYEMEIIDTPFQVRPGKNRTFQVTLSVFTNTHKSSDTFQIVVELEKDMMVSDGESVTVTISKKETGEDDDKVFFSQESLIVLTFICLILLIPYTAFSIRKKMLKFGSKNPFVDHPLGSQGEKEEKKQHSNHSDGVPEDGGNERTNPEKL